MSTCLVIGDPHFKTNNFQETERMVNDIRLALIREPVSFIVVLGDVLDRHEQIHIEPLNRAIKFLLMLTEFAPTYVLIGNHDRPNNQDFLSDKSPFYGLHYHPRLTIVDKVIEETIDERQFIFVPYVPPGKFHQALRTLDPSDDETPRYMQATIIFAHQEFKGAKSGVHESSGGDVWSADEPIVITGHFHDYQRLSSNILYVGTPFQHTFAESVDKSISRLVIPSNPKTLDDLTETRIKLSIPPRQTLTYTFKEFTELVPSWNTGSRIRFIVLATISEAHTLKSHPNYRECSKHGHKIECRIIQSESDRVVIESNDISFEQRFKERLKTDPEVYKLMQELQLA